MQNRLKLSFASVAVAALSVLATVDQTWADALSDLNNEFRRTYAAAAARTLSDMKSSVPVLVNRFGQIALYRPGADKPDLFAMDMKAYLEARAVAHTPAALYAGLAPFGLGRLDNDRLQWVQRYQSLLSAAEAQIRTRTDIPESVRTIQVGMLADVRRIAQRIQQQGAVDQTILNEMGSTVRDAVRKNLEFGAASQLDQFRKRVEQWKATYSALAWDRAVVVIIGFHQARDRYLQRQFFDWLLHDSPTRQDRVVYAETLTLPASVEGDALVLLSKVMLDKGLSNVIFADPLTLQADVLGDAAEEIIRNWH